MTNEREVTNMLEYLIKLFISTAYATNSHPAVVDAVQLDESTLEVTMTDEKVYIITVNEIDYGA